MTITPDTAKELLDGFVESWEGPDEEMYQVAPDLAATIARMTWEWAAQIKEGGTWVYLGLYGPDEPWGSEEDVRDYHARSPLPNTRLVRRLVSAPEVVEGE